MKPEHELKEAARQGIKRAADANDIEKVRALLHHEWSSDSVLPPLEADDLYPSSFGASPPQLRQPQQLTILCSTFRATNF
jgi:hypothetical protein